jgi:hypothetical protein
MWKKQRGVYYCERKMDSYSKCVLSNDIINHILKFIICDPITISSLQQTCKEYINFKSDELQEHKNKWWNKIQKLIGVDNTIKLKRGSSYTGNISFKHYKSRRIKKIFKTMGDLKYKDWKLLEPALRNMTSLTSICFDNFKLTKKKCDIISNILTKMTALEHIELTDLSEHAYILVPKLRNMKYLKSVKWELYNKHEIPVKYLNGSELKKYKKKILAFFLPLIKNNPMIKVNIKIGNGIKIYI